MTETTKLAGAVALDSRKSLEELVGAELLEAALSSLPREEQDEMRALTAVGWVRISTMETLLHAIARLQKRDVHDVNVEMNRRGIERTFSTIWRVFLRVTTDNALLGRAPIIYARTYDQGRLEVAFPSSGRMEAAIHGRPGMSSLAVDAFGVGVDRVLTLAGRKDVKLVSSKLPDGASYVGTWKR